MTTLHRLSVDEYVSVVRMFSWASTELIDGLVYDRLPTARNHAETVAAVFGWLRATHPGAIVLPGGSVQLDDSTLIEPGLVVATEGIHLESFVPAAAVLLVVEVIAESVSDELGPKLRACARAGVPEVWVIDPRAEAGYLLRHVDPHGELYAGVHRHDVGENAARLIDAGIPV